MINEYRIDRNRDHRRGDSPISRETPGSSMQFSEWDRERKEHLSVAGDCLLGQRKKSGRAFLTNDKRRKIKIVHFK